MLRDKAKECSKLFGYQGSQDKFEGIARQSSWRGNINLAGNANTWEFRSSVEFAVLVAQSVEADIWTITDELIVFNRQSVFVRCW